MEKINTRKVSETAEEPIVEESDESFTHKCLICDKTYSSGGSLNKHMRNIHKDKVGPNYKVTSINRNLVCPICSNEFISKKLYETHLLSDHNIELERENLTFASEVEFQDWKTKMQAESNSSFVKNSGTRTKDGVKFYYLYCLRTGYFSGSMQERKRRLKQLGTNKINGVCPAMMKVSYVDDSIVVDFVKTHVGHDNDARRLPLTPDQRKNIAVKLANNIPISSILDEVRDSLTTDSPGRFNLLKRRDVLNIRKQFNVNMPAIQDENDAESVHKWVLSMAHLNENSPIRYYKQQGTIDPNFPCLDKDDFLLVIMNTTLVEMLQQFGNDVISIDFMHGMNCYNFDLATILILDHKREAFPAAFILSNRQDSAALGVAFQRIKMVGINIQPHIFMSDDTDEFYNAWVSVFGAPVERLLCSWHVDRIWRNQIETFISNRTEQMRVYKTLRCLLTQSDETAFSLMLIPFIIELEQNEETREFCAYFRNIFEKRAHVWSYCFRKWASMETNMHLERMHRTIKYIFLEGRKVRRLDVAIQSLMKFLSSKIANQHMSLKKGKIKSKTSNLKKRHQEAKKMSKDNVIKDEIMPNQWTVSTSSSDADYDVYYIGACNPNCQLICSGCLYCIHNFACTCIDNSIQWNMCKHIHLVCSTLDQTADPKTNDSADDDWHNTGADDWPIDESYNQCKRGLDETTYQKQAKKQCIATVVGVTTPTTTVVNNMQLYNRKLKNICGETIDRCTSIADYETLEKMLSAALTAFNAHKQRMTMNWQY